MSYPPNKIDLWYHICSLKNEFELLSLQEGFLFFGAANSSGGRAIPLVLSLFGVDKTCTSFRFCSGKEVLQICSQHSTGYTPEKSVVGRYDISFQHGPFFWHMFIFRGYHKIKRNQQAVWRWKWIERSLETLWNEDRFWCFFGSGGRSLRIFYPRFRGFWMLVKYSIDSRIHEMHDL